MALDFNPCFLRCDTKSKNNNKKKVGELDYMEMKTFLL